MLAAAESARHPALPSPQPCAQAHTVCAAPLNVVSKSVARRVLCGAEEGPRGGRDAMTA